MESDVLAKYFQELLTTGQDSCKISYAEPRILIPLLDEIISIDELHLALQYAKDIIRLQELTVYHTNSTKTHHWDLNIKS